MADRSSRPHASPSRTPARTERRIVKLRVTRRLGPARIAFRLGLPPSTVHAVLTRYGRPRLAHLDRATGSPVRRYERERLGELVHVDVKKLGYGYLHTALDDFSRLGYTEILPDERKETAAAFLTRAHAWYATAGIAVAP
jgi:hypothetical protein